VGAHKKYYTCMYVYKEYIIYNHFIFYIYITIKYYNTLYIYIYIGSNNNI